DQLGSPTYAIDLARAIIQLCRKGAKGVVHVTNRGECTWFDFTQAIVSAAGSKTIVHPTTTEKFPRPAKRPKYSVLSASRLGQYGISKPDWQDALRRYLIERSSAGNPDFRSCLLSAGTSFVLISLQSVNCSLTAFCASWNASLSALVGAVSALSTAASNV